jgi:hypothetical protein
MDKERDSRRRKKPNYHNHIVNIYKQKASPNVDFYSPSKTLKFKEIR